MGNSPKMVGNTSKPSKVASQTQGVRKQNIPVQMTEMSTFDDSYVNMKNRFTDEMKRVDEYMFALSKALNTFYNQTLTSQTGLTSNTSNAQVNWEDIINSPLVDDSGDETMLKLQFDLSQFSPDEVEVKIADNNILTVNAVHDKKSDDSSEHREYHRYFALPGQTNPESVISSLSRDGVLTVQVPLQQPPSQQPPLQQPEPRQQ